MSSKQKILYLIAAVVFLGLIIGLSFYFRSSQKISPRPPKPGEIVISSLKNFGKKPPSLLAQILPSDFDRFSPEIVQNEKRELSNGDTQYVFTYFSLNETLRDAYDRYRDYLSKNATLTIDRLYKDNFLLEAKSPERSFHFVGFLSPGNQGKNLITLSWLEPKK